MNKGLLRAGPRNVNTSVNARSKLWGQAEYAGCGEAWMLLNLQPVGAGLLGKIKLKLCLLARINDANHYRGDSWLWGVIAAEWLWCVIIIVIIPFTAKCNCPASPRRINAAFQVEGARVVLHRMLVLTQCIQPVIKMHYSKQNQGLCNAAAGKGHIR